MYVIVLLLAHALTSSRFGGFAYKIQNFNYKQSVCLRIRTSL